MSGDRLKSWTRSAADTPLIRWIAIPLVSLLVSATVMPKVQAQHVFTSVTGAAGGVTSDDAFTLLGTLGETTVGRTFGPGMYSTGFWFLAARPATGTPIENVDLTDIPETYRLEANYPNPFNPQTVITFGLPERASVRLTVYDVVGRRIQTLVDGDQPPGVHRVTFAGDGLPSGLYFYRMDAGAFSDVGSMLLLR